MRCPSSLPGGAGTDAVLEGYRACLRRALRVLVDDEGTPTTDPRVLALSSHLCRRQAAVELQEELHRQHEGQQHLRRQLLDHYFRGVDLHCMASSR